MPCSITSRLFSILMVRRAAPVLSRLRWIISVLFVGLCFLVTCPAQANEPADTACVGQNGKINLGPGNVESRTLERLELKGLAGKYCVEGDGAIMVNDAITAKDLACTLDVTEDGVFSLAIGETKLGFLADGKSLSSEKTEFGDTPPGAANIYFIKAAATIPKIDGEEAYEGFVYVHANSVLSTIFP